MASPSRVRNSAQLLKEARFTAVAWSQALFMPPFEKSLVLRSAPAWERLGSWLSPAFSGVIIVEAVKQVYAIPPGTAGAPPGAAAQAGTRPAIGSTAAETRLLILPFAFETGLIMKGAQVGRTSNFMSNPPEGALGRIREDIDAIDDAMLALLAKRFAAVEQVRADQGEGWRHQPIADPAGA